jgi:HEAT repeat protein
MRRTRGKRATLWAAAIGLLVLGAASLALKDRIVEEWYLGVLESEDPADQLTAIEVLESLRSERALPRLLEIAAAWENFAVTARAADAMVRIGPEGQFLLLSRIIETPEVHDPRLRTFDRPLLLRTLDRIAKEGRTPETRKEAAETLQAIRDDQVCSPGTDRER